MCAATSPNCARRCEALRVSNLQGLGGAPRSSNSALDDLETATEALLDMLGGGRTEAALAGATPYLRLFALASGGALLARGAVASGAAERVALCRFFAENLPARPPRLRERVIDGGDSLAAARKVLVA